MISNKPQYGNQANQKILEITDDHSLTQVNQQPTRYNHILDLVMTTNPSIVIDTQAHPGMSDHFIIISSLKVQPLRSKTEPRTFYQFLRANFPALQEDLANT